MKHKRIKKFSLGALLMLAFLCISVKVQADDWTRYQNSSFNNGVTANPGPTDADHAVLQWAVKMPEATTPPLIIGSKVYTASGNYVYCYDKTTGKELGRSDKLAGSVGFALHPMVYANGRLFVITEKNGAMIEALGLSDPANPSKLWSSDPKPGTSYSPLTYHDGCLYTGTWNGDSHGYYFCVDAATGTVKWFMEDPNGFYWDGACAVGNFVAFASENAAGGDNEADGSTLYTVNAKTGEKIDSLPDLKGSIRNTVVYDDGYLYVGTVAGRLYRIKVDAAGHLGNYSYLDLEGRIKATMIIDQKQLYVGVEGKTPGSSVYKVIDCSKDFDRYSTIGTVRVPNEPKGAPILSTAEGSKRYIYFTCNDGNGGIYYFTNENKNLSACRSLFEPESSQQEKCISSLALDSEGTLYYTNDSRYLMAVSPKLIKNVDMTPSSGLRWTEQKFSPAVRSYKLTADASVDEITLDVQKLDGDTDVSYKCIVNGSDKGSVSKVSLNEEYTTLELKVTRKAITQVYTFSIRKMTSQNTSLGLLYYGQNYYSGGNLLPAIAEGKTEYSTDLRNVSISNPYLWIRPADVNASVRVYAVENIEDIFGALKSGDELDPVYEEKTGELRFDIVPVDAGRNTVLRVRVISADNSRYTDYQLTFIRREEHHHAWSSTWNCDAGYHWHECAGTGSACDVVQNSQKNGFEAHTGNWVVTQSPTCTAEGVETFICTVCGYTITRSIPVGGHNFGPWVQSTPATVSTEEIHKRSCNVCGFTEEKIAGGKVAPVLELPGNLNSLSIKKGATAKFTLIMAASDSILSVTSGNAKYVKVTSFQRTGAISLKAQNKGKTTVTIKLASGKSRRYSVNVVTGTIKTTNVKVDNTNITLEKNKTMALRPVVTPFTSTQKLTYKSSNRKVVSVTSAGKIKAVAAGTAKVTVSSGSKKKVVTVHVPGITIAKTSVTVKRNQTYSLKPKRYGIADPLTCRSSNTAIATVTADGKIRGRKKGTATITVQAGPYAVKCKVKVK